MALVEYDESRNGDMYSEVREVLHRRGYMVDEGDGDVVCEGDGVVVTEVEEGLDIEAPSQSEADIIANMLSP